MAKKPDPYYPPGYNNEDPVLVSTKTFNGTDLYLTIVTVFLTSMIVKTGLTVVLLAHNLTLSDNYIWTLMGITGAIAGKNCLAKEFTLLYKIRVCNSITSALQTVFICPFTAVAQAARSLTDGFNITRNLFD